jgi:hypothetical protein
LLIRIRRPVFTFTVLSMGKIVLTCVLALVFGFAGAGGAVYLFQDQFEGPQGPTGLTGAPGPAGQDGADGVDGATGPRGLQGKQGKPGKDAEEATAPATDLGTDGCAGKSITVITSASIDENQKLDLTKKDVCIVAPPEDSTSSTADTP